MRHLPKILSISVGLFLAPLGAQADNIATIRDMAIEAQGNIATGSLADVPALRAEQEALLAQAHAALQDLASTHPEFADLMGFVIGETDNMLAMSLDQIEAEWHRGQALESAGYMNTTTEHFGVLNSYVDMVVHPATVVILLREFEQSGDAALLEQAQEELAELAAHIEHI